MSTILKIHGNTVVDTVPCGVHPLHAVKVRASGARSGCPMCEAAIEDLCRSMKRKPKGLSIFDAITWSSFCLVWRLIGNEILQTKEESP